MVRQFQYFDIETIKDEILKITHQERIFQLRGANRNYNADNLVIASGTEPIIPTDISAMHHQ
jgi:thioredoxin reductase